MITLTFHAFTFTLFVTLVLFYSPLTIKIRSSLSDLFTSVLVFRIYSFALDTLTRHRWGFGLPTLSLAPFLSCLGHALRLSPALCSRVSLSPFLSSALCTSPLFQTSKLPSESVTLAALPHFSLFCRPPCSQRLKRKVHTSLFIFHFVSSPLFKKGKEGWLTYFITAPRTSIFFSSFPAYVLL